MCGIVGVISKTTDFDSVNANLLGLEKLEYRGYDSAGIAILTNEENEGNVKIDYRKAVGKLVNLKEELINKPFGKSTISIGHTRWATHGTPNIVNTHPHISSDKKIALVHNGIVENASSLKAKYKIQTNSNTDTAIATEVLAKIYSEEKDILSSIKILCKTIKGSYSLVIISPDYKDTIFAVRHNSPLLIGLGDDVNFLGSDTLAFSKYTTKAIQIEQDQIVAVKSDEINIFDQNLAKVDFESQKFEVDKSLDSQKGGFDTYMEKEIFDTPKAVEDTLLGSLVTNKKGEKELELDKLEFSEKLFRDLNKIVVIACGTAAHSAYVARYSIEHWTRIPVEVEYAHEFRYRDPILDSKTLVIAISQSGETMDTLMALRYSKEQGSKTLAICNSKDSTLARESDAVLYTNAGREISVASTKAFTCMVVACLIIALYLARVRNSLSKEDIKNKIDELYEIPQKIGLILKDFREIFDWTSKLKDVESVLFLGRHTGFPIALEGALKLKEIAYIHSEGFAAGELKHGPIAIISEGQLVVVVIPPVEAKGDLHSKVISNIQEILSRGAKVIAVCEKGDKVAKDLSIHTFEHPKTTTLFSPLLDIIPLQIFALSLSTTLGLDVDQPRNLAKSVTVE